MRRTDFLAGLLLFSAACSGGQKPAPATEDQPVAPTTAATERAAAAAALANAIAATPAAADSLLRAAGHTAESFQNLMYEIAADSAMAAAYAAARTQ